MKRIVFLVPSTGREMGRPSTPHVGIACLAAYVREHGYDPHVIDLRVEQMSPDVLKERLDHLAPQFVAMTSTSFRYLDVYELINRISGWGWPVIYGGPHVSTVGDKVFDGCRPVAAIYGEGEKPLLDILSGQELRTINGLIYRDRNGEIVTNPPAESIADLDSLPFAAYELFKMGLYGEKKIPLSTSRGCPCHCTYCSVRYVMDKGFRARSPGNVIAEIEKWHKKGYRLFGINDDNFTADIGRAHEICDLLIERKIRIFWELRTGVRIDRVDGSLLGKMKRAGCVFLAFGIESIDDTVLALAQKGTHFSQIESTLNAAEKVGIPFSGFFMIGLPGDTFEKFRKLYHFALTHDFDEVRFYNLEPYPRTEVYDWVQTNGKFIAHPEDYLNEACLLQNPPVFETAEFPFEERMAATRMGEYLTVKKMVEKTMGRRMGRLVGFFVKQRHVRAMVLRAGFMLSPFVRRIHLRRAVSVLGGGLAE